MTGQDSNDPQSGKPWLPLTGSALALVALGLVAVAGAGTIMMMM